MKPDKLVDPPARRSSLEKVASTPEAGRPVYCRSDRRLPFLGALGKRIAIIVVSCFYQAAELNELKKLVALLTPSASS